MKKNSVLCLLIAFQGVVGSAAAFQKNNPFDFFVCYGKRNNTIDEIIRESLDSEPNKWKRVRVPVTEEFVRGSSYSPEQDSSIEFRFEELDYTNHPNIRTLDDILRNQEKEAEALGSKKRTLYEGKDKFVIKRIVTKITHIKNDTDELTFELSNHEGSQPGTSTETKTVNLFGEIFRDKSISLQEEVVKEQPSTVILNWIVNLGDAQFRAYSFKVENKTLCAEEIKYLLELFKHMEEQIKHVPL